MNGLSKHLKSQHRANGKFASTSKERSDSIESLPQTVPIIRQAENSSMLAKYTNVLARTADDGVTMEDLDALQQDLEKLLSCCALRNRYLRTEMETHDRDERRKGKSSMKRKRTDEKPKQKDFKNGARIIKKTYGHGVVNNLVGETPVRQDIPKVAVPRNDTSDKFWNSVEPFCSEIQPEDVAFLDSLIEECTKEVSVKIPPLGEHYTEEWSDDIILDDSKPAKYQHKQPNSDLKKVLDTFRERVISNIPTANEKCQPSDLETLLKNFPSQRMGLCMEKRLRDDLDHEISDKPPEEDDILMEIKKCEQELAVLNEYNIQELTKLKKLVQTDIKRQVIKNKLTGVDNEILAMYNKMLQEKQIAAQSENEIDRAALNRQIAKDFQGPADNLLKQQQALNRELRLLSENYTLF